MLNVLEDLINLARQRKQTPVDGSYTNKLLNDKKFIHGVDFYGSFLSIKNDFEVDVYDDLEFLDESEYFHENKNEKFRS